MEVVPMPLTWAQRFLPPRTQGGSQTKKEMLREKTDEQMNILAL